VVSEVRTGGIKTLLRINVVYLLLLLGMGMIMAAFVIGLVLSLVSGDYYAESKATRDAAEVGSSLLADLGQVQAVQAWLLPFKFLGIATFFAGIGLALSAIIKRIQLRGQVMAEGLRELLTTK
jgi:Kef-type K+ transport system membrane component KefB